MKVEIRSDVIASRPIPPVAALDRPDGSSPAPLPLDYQPGVCNIGPAEIARRQRAGHVGLAATGVLLAGLAIARAPAPARFLVALPAAGAASGYLQARLRFCAGFGSRGVLNFGDLGQTISVDDDKARAADRARAFQIGLASAAIGATVGLGAVLAAR